MTRLWNLWSRTGARVSLLICSLFFVLSVLATAQTTLPPRMRGPVPVGPDAARLLRGQTAYVLADCHLCHGVTLAEARGGGADLAHSRVVEMDENGSMIEPVVRAGLPRTQTAMPSYPDLPANQLADMIAYIHFMRQQLHEKTALAPPATSGNVAAGRAYFFDNCASCHNGAQDLQRAVTSYDAQTLRARIIRPAVAGPLVKSATAGRSEHLKLLESLEASDASNLVAYLQSSRGAVSADMARAMKSPPREISTRVERNCSVCHGPAGSGGDRAPALVNNADIAGMDADGVKAILKGGLPGGMPAFHFSEPELDEYAAWLKARSPKL
jgi:mono/diheme cytochrome c family protein